MMAPISSIVEDELPLYFMETPRLVRGHTIKKRLFSEFGNSGAVLAWVGSAVIYAGAEVAHNGLPATNIGGVGGDRLDFVAAFLKFRNDVWRDARFEFRVTAFEGELGHAGAFERHLDIKL